MVPELQTNYFFVDLQRRTANGRTEIEVFGETDLLVTIGNLKIHQVLVNGDSADYTDVFQLINRPEKFVDTFDPFKTQKAILIKTKNQKNQIQIKYEPKIQFYQPLDKNDEHREAIGTMYDSILFPYVENLIKFKLIFVADPDFIVSSTGKLENVVEQNNYAIHTFSTSTFAKNISFVIGKFEKHEISSSTSMILPKYLDHSEIKNCIISSQRTLFSFLNIEQNYPMDFVFTFLDFKAVSKSLVIIPFASFPCKTEIAQNFNFRSQLGMFYGYQFISNIEFKQEDLWIKQGIIGYIESFVLKLIFGTNEFIYRLKKDMEYIVSVDKFHLPLYSRNRSLDSYDSKYVKCKSKLLFQVLENLTNSTSIKKILKTLFSLQSITTESFINIVKESTGRDLSNEKLIFRNVCSTYTGEIQIDQKKNAVKVTFNAPINTLLQSNEIEGVFEYPIKKELTYNYHNRRKREDESVLFIKIDPYFTQVNNYKFLLKNTMYSSLTKDKNIISQMEGVQHVDETELERIINDTHTNYHVRLLAMDYLGINSIFTFFVRKFCIHGSTIIRPNSFTILNHFLLVGLMKSLSFFDPSTERTIKDKNITVGAIIKAFYYNILRYNDNSSNYFSDSTFISSIIKSFSFMFVLLSDRTISEFVDKNELYFDIIERYRLKDLIFPSNENQITCSVLYFYGRLDLHGIIKLNENFLFNLLKEKNYISVRSRAAEILTIKAVLDENVFEPLRRIKLLLETPEIIQKVVLQTFLNFLRTKSTNERVKKVLQIEMIEEIIAKSENNQLKRLAYDVVNFLKENDFPINEIQTVENEISSTTNEQFTEPMPKVRVKCVPIGNFVVKLKIKPEDQVEKPTLCRVKPIFSNNGVVKLKILQNTAENQNEAKDSAKRLKKEGESV